MQFCYIYFLPTQDHLGKSIQPKDKFICHLWLGYKIWLLTSTFKIDFSLLHLIFVGLFYMFSLGSFFLKDFLDVDHFKVFIEFVTVPLFYILIFWPWGIWDLSTLTRDQARTPCIWRRSLNPWTSRETPAGDALNAATAAASVCVTPDALLFPWITDLEADFQVGHCYQHTHFPSGAPGCSSF